MNSRNQKNKNNLNSFLNTYFSLLIVAAVVFVLIVAYFIVLRPKFNSTLAVINDNFNQQQTYYKNQSEKLINLKSLGELYRKINPADLQKFNSLLPDQYAKERLFGELDEVISRNGFIINSIALAANDKPAVGLATSSPQVGILDVTLNISAVDYAGFKNLLKLLENNLRLFDVTAVTFSPNGENAKLVLSTYYYKKSQ